MTFYVLRFEDNPEQFLTEDGPGHFRHSTLYTFDAQEAFQHFLANVPPGLELVEIVMQPLTGTSLN